jgi:exopolyphosphatase/guanosine-5'-triphosphate,3'-diphosphate pyrophosphatase
VVSRLLSPERLLRARAVGTAMRLGCDLSGRSRALLERSSLRLDKSRVILSADHSAADLLLGEQTARRSATLASILERDLKIEG